MKGPVVLLTDFGTKDPFVGVMKGVILSYAPESVILDLTHEVPPQNIQVAAFYLMTSFQYFPEGSLFVVVVDPGVGTERKLIWARTQHYQFIAPDNGVLSWVEEKEKILGVRWIANNELFLREVSATFHGRDMIAPAAARILNGLDPDVVGPEQEVYKRIPFVKAQREGNMVQGRVVAIDRFGNAITNIGGKEIQPDVRFFLKGQSLGGLKPSYSHVPEGETVVVVGSSGFVELAVRKGNMARQLDVREGDRVDANDGANISD